MESYDLSQKECLEGGGSWVEVSGSNTRKEQVEEGAQEKRLQRNQQAVGTEWKWCFCHHVGRKSWGKRRIHIIMSLQGRPVGCGMSIGHIWPLEGCWKFHWVDWVERCRLMKPDWVWEVESLISKDVEPVRMEIDMSFMCILRKRRKASSGCLRARVGGYCLINRQTWTHLGSFHWREIFKIQKTRSEVLEEMQRDETHRSKKVSS